jgi:hypothetical protein
MSTFEQSRTGSVMWRCLIFQRDRTRPEGSDCGNAGADFVTPVWSYGRSLRQKSINQVHESIEPSSR